MPRLTTQPAVPFEQLCVLAGDGPGDADLLDRIVSEWSVELVQRQPLVLALPVPAAPELMELVLAFEASRFDATPVAA